MTQPGRRTRVNVLPKALAMAQKWAAVWSLTECPSWALPHPPFAVLLYRSC
jgi:hypothetical protein